METLPKKDRVQPDRETPQSDPADKDRLTIHITRYAPLIDIIKNPGSIFRFSLFITLITAFLFFGMVLITITIKRIYPYNDIQTNALGAMTFKTEDKDVTYWLFNTAELWADSGIQVEKNDIITIRASGGSHTAIHHLVDNVRGNKQLTDPWCGTEGVPQKQILHDSLRAKWRILPHQPSDVLIMQIIPVGESPYDPRGCIKEEYLNNDNIHLIGKERTDLYITQSGKLYFAVNDIVLTPRTIYEMFKDQMHHLAPGNRLVENFFRDHEKRYPEINKGSVETMFSHIGENDILSKLYADNRKSYYKFGPAPAAAGKEAPNTVSENEMSYYNKNDYSNVWYDDNIGSFLIVIEHKKK